MLRRVVSRVSNTAIVKCSKTSNKILVRSNPIYSFNQYYNSVCSSINSSNRQCQYFSTTATTTAATTESEEYPIDTIGRMYHNMRYKGRVSNNVRLFNLKVLFDACSKAEDIKYITKGLDFYQFKGMDFTEELNAQFINACLRSSDVKTAISTFSKYENRISAWTSPKSLKKLVDAAVDSSRSNIEDPMDVIKVLVILKSKGTTIPNTIIDTVMKAYSDSSKLTATMVEETKKLSTGKDDDAVISKYTPTAPATPEDSSSTPAQT